MSGTVYGLGVGPGDPELITLKALRLLRAAPVIAYPAPDIGDSFARRIVAPHLPGGQTEIAIRMPLGEAQFPKAEIYAAAAEKILGHVGVGRDVAVLCEGDPFFYGSFVYLFERLVERCPVEIVAGVSSLMACAGVAGRPLARRNETLAIVPAPLPDDRLRARFAGTEALAVIKVGRHLSRVRRLLAACGRLDGACLVERATLGNQRIAALRDLRDDAAPYFSMILLPSREGAR
jgi:precorrin-2/cobalt-factor-2 C20-methyltransferase